MNQEVWYTSEVAMHPSGPCPTWAAAWADWIQEQTATVGVEPFGTRRLGGHGNGLIRVNNPRALLQPKDMSKKQARKWKNEQAPVGMRNSNRAVAVSP